MCAKYVIKNLKAKEKKNIALKNVILGLNILTIQNTNLLVIIAIKYFIHIGKILSVVQKVAQKKAKKIKKYYNL